MNRIIIKCTSIFSSKILLLSFLLLGFSVATVCAQLQSSQERKVVREGNKMYTEKKYSDAETLYRKGLEADRSSKTSAYNLGDALYKQGKFEEASSQFQNVTDQKGNKKAVSDAYHNLGNSLLKSEKYQESVDAFKKSLISDPSDNDTRYNLAYAMSKLQQQQQQQQQNKDNKENKDNKDQQKKDQQNKDQKDKQKQEQQKQDQQKQDQQKQDQNQAQKQKPKISKEDAERMLAALKNDEKDLQKRMQKKTAAKVGIVKNW